MDSSGVILVCVSESSWLIHVVNEFEAEVPQHSETLFESVWTLAYVPVSREMEMVFSVEGCRGFGADQATGV